MPFPSGNIVADPGKFRPDVSETTGAKSGKVAPSFVRNDELHAADLSDSLLRTPMKYGFIAAEAALAAAAKES